MNTQKSEANPKFKAFTLLLNLLGAFLPILGFAIGGYWYGKFNSLTGPGLLLIGLGYGSRLWAKSVQTYYQRPA